MLWVRLTFVGDGWSNRAGRRGTQVPDANACNSPTEPSTHQLTFSINSQNRILPCSPTFTVHKPALLYINLNVWNVQLKALTEQKSLSFSSCNSLPDTLQEIWANADETHESEQQFLFAGCLGLSPIILSQFTLLHPKTAKKSVRVQGHSRSSMLIPLKSTSPVLVMISSMSLCLSATVFTLDKPIAGNSHF